MIIKAKLFAEKCLVRIDLLRTISQSFSSEMPSGKSFISRLNNRSLFVMHGPQTYKLLQGLTTNDMNLLSSKPIQNKRGQSPPMKSSFDLNQELQHDRVSLYTLFLNPKGKLITDAFIYKPKTFQNGQKVFRQDQLWIDVHSSTKKDLFHHLRKYMWKKEVELVDIDNQPDQHKPSVYVGYNHISTISAYLEQGTELKMKAEQPREEEYANMMMFDPRGGNFGRRILCMQEELGIPSNQFQQQSSSMYDDFERALGFTPTSLTRTKLPFQFNYDFLNAISFKKGCYLGQEIVSRSYFTGIVRRRVFPFLVDPEANLTDSQQNEIKEGCRLFNENNEEIGKVLYYEKGKAGLALAPYLNYFPQEEPESQADKISNSQEADQHIMSIRIVAPFEGVLYCPFKQTLKKYITDTRSKQKTLEELDI